MFNLLLALTFGLIIGWLLHAFYIELNTPTPLRGDSNFSKSYLAIKEELNRANQTTKEKIATAPSLKKEEHKKNTQQVDQFLKLLNQGSFSDAMALYLEAPNSKLPLYRSMLLSYFKRLKDRNLSITQMLEYMELEPEHQKVAYLLIEFYTEAKAYPKAVELIDKLIESATPIELEFLYTQLIKTSQLYLDYLKEAKNFHTLVSFLEERIEIGTKASFFIYALAKYYFDEKNYLQSQQLLKEIEFDEDYTQKAKTLLEIIEQKIKEQNEYTYKIPLKKQGSHFIIQAKIDDTPLNLLLDTGATYTLINRDKISSLEVVEENIILQTASGAMEAQLFKTESFFIGDIELKEFKVVGSYFNQKETDGLLGMNFLKKFKFKIDQDEGVLYLSKEDNTTLE